jgi:hypothetical protein
MSNLSNNKGRAYEFACLISLENEIRKYRPVIIVENSSYNAAKRAWDSLDMTEQATYRTSALAGAQTIFTLEPLILEDGTDMLELKMQTDAEGKAGDVRDVLIIRRGIEWEIGLSIKHNHFAVKHSRLAKSLDFGEKWFGIKCSEQYWQDILPIFSYLANEKASKRKWSELPAKENDVYIPLLQAFIDEIKRSYAENGSTIARKMVEYLLGEYDFYKVISIDGQRITQIQTFNLRGSLNKSGKSKPMTIVPIAALPTRIVSLDFKPGSSNTVELYLDNGWQFGFRIHNASTYVETSLKFDIQIIGVPATIISINCKWGD